MWKQVETWERSELTDVTAKVVIYEAFVEGEVEAKAPISELKAQRLLAQRGLRPRVEPSTPQSLALT
jgi:hypothetical protein